MKIPQTQSMLRLLLAGAIVALVSASTSAQAQVLLGDFNANSFNSTNNTLTDSVAGVIATGTGTNVAGAGTVVTTNGGFTFGSGSIAGLDGLTSYTIAVGFIYNGGAPGGANAYQGQGALGGDIGGAQQGDAAIAVTADGGGQIVAGGGQPNNGDYSLYDTSPTGPNDNARNFITGSPTGAVLVVNGTTDTASFYVNGLLSQTLTFAGGTPIPFGQNNGTVGSWTLGIGTNANGNNGNPYNSLNGSIYDAQIYSGALSSTQASALSLSIDQVAAVPEPSSYALLALGAGMLVLFAHRRSVVSA